MQAASTQASVLPPPPVLRNTLECDRFALEAAQHSATPQGHPTSPGRAGRDPVRSSNADHLSDRSLTPHRTSLGPALSAQPNGLLLDWGGSTLGESASPSPEKETRLSLHAHALHTIGNLLTAETTAPPVQAKSAAKAMPRTNGLPVHLSHQPDASGGWALTPRGTNCSTPKQKPQRRQNSTNSSTATSTFGENGGGAMPLRRWESAEGALATPSHSTVSSSTSIPSTRTALRRSCNGMPSSQTPSSGRTSPAYLAAATMASSSGESPASSRLWSGQRGIIGRVDLSSWQKEEASSRRSGIPSPLPSPPAQRAMALTSSPERGSWPSGQEPLPRRNVLSRPL
jgi:hypothetical protein